MTARRVRLTPLSEVEPLPAPWPHYPHCPRCDHRIVAATPQAATARRLRPFDGVRCPYCHGEVAS